MGSAADTIDLFQLWTQSGQDAERKLQKFLLAGLDQVKQLDSGIFPKFKKGATISTPVVRWMEELDYPSIISATLSTTTLTIPDTYKPFGSAIDADSFAQCIRQGTILERLSDGMQCKVTTAEASLPSSTPWAVTVAAHGASSLSNNASAEDYEIISEEWTDYRDAEHPRGLDRTFRKVGCQIYAETFKIPKSRKNTKYELVADEVEHQIKALIEKLYRQRARAMLRQQPAYSGGVPVYGDAAEASFNCGLSHWPVITQAEKANTGVYVNKATAPLTKTDIDDLVYNMLMDENVNFNSGNWVLAVHPFTNATIQDWDHSFVRTTRTEDVVGSNVRSIDTKIGKNIPIISDRYLRNDVAMVIDLSNISWGDYAQDSMDRKELQTQGRYQEWLVSFQSYGVVVRKPRQSIGMIYGLPTS